MDKHINGKSFDEKLESLSNKLTNFQKKLEKFIEATGGSTSSGEDIQSCADCAAKQNMELYNQYLNTLSPMDSRMSYEEFIRQHQQYFKPDNYNRIGNQN